MPENEIAWLPGYENSLPVRIGNAAVEQTQLDVHGEPMDALHAAREAELSPLDEVWRLQKTLLAHVEAVWREPGYGIWEVRGAGPGVHPFAAHVLGGVRPGGKVMRALRPRRAGGSLACGPRRDRCRHLRQRLRCPA